MERTIVESAKDGIGRCCRRPTAGEERRGQASSFTSYAQELQEVFRDSLRYMTSTGFERRVAIGGVRLDERPQSSRRTMKVGNADAIRRLEDLAWACETVAVRCRNRNVCIPSSAAGLPGVFTSRMMRSAMSIHVLLFRPMRDGISSPSSVMQTPRSPRRRGVRRPLPDHLRDVARGACRGNQQSGIDLGATHRVGLVTACGIVDRVGPRRVHRQARKPSTPPVQTLTAKRSPRWPPLRLAARAPRGPPSDIRPR